MHLFFSSHYILDIGLVPSHGFIDKGEVQFILVFAFCEFVSHWKTILRSVHPIEYIHKILGERESFLLGCWTRRKDAGRDVILPERILTESTGEGGLVQLGDVIN